MKILNFRLFQKGMLIGFFDLELPSSMVIKSMKLMLKDNQYFVTFPTEEKLINNEKKFFPHIYFKDDSKKDAFQKQVIELLSPQIPSNKKQTIDPTPKQDELPF